MQKKKKCAKPFANKLFMKLKKLLKTIRLLLIDSVTWNHTIVSKLFVLDKNIRYPITQFPNLLA